MSGVDKSNHIQSVNANGSIRMTINFDVGTNPNVEPAPPGQEFTYTVRPTGRLTSGESSARLSSGRIPTARSCA